jgi:hypothetical protein
MVGKSPRAAPQVGGCRKLSLPGCTRTLPIVASVPPFGLPGGQPPLRSGSSARAEGELDGRPPSAPISSRLLEPGLWDQRLLACLLRRRGLGLVYDSPYPVHRLLSELLSAAYQAIPCAA